ncbi:MAG TPA: response regulator transcription factor [Ilumatobacteraceae bacterium]|nr:response regulator transcription factor [Ilumatobacteraceae bacterium]
MLTLEPGPCPLAIAVVNDYELVLAGVRSMLEPFADRVVVVETDVGGTPERNVDIALFDTFAGRRGVLERTQTMAGDPSVGKVVLYTWDVPEEFARDLGSAPVDAVIMKSATGIELVEALEAVHRDEPTVTTKQELFPGSAALSMREREILALLGCGFSNREIAEELYLSVNTVKSHVAKLFAKLAVANRTQAARVAIEHGLTPRRS